MPRSRGTPGISPHYLEIVFTSFWYMELGYLPILCSEWNEPVVGIHFDSFQAGILATTSYMRSSQFTSLEIVFSTFGLHRQKFLLLLMLKCNDAVVWIYSTVFWRNILATKPYIRGTPGTSPHSLKIVFTTFGLEGQNFLLLLMLKCNDAVVWIHSTVFETFILATMPYIRGTPGTSPQSLEIVFATFGHQIQYFLLLLMINFNQAVVWIHSTHYLDIVLKC